MVLFKFNVLLFTVCSIFVPETYNNPFIFVVLFNVVYPLTFKDDDNVVLINFASPLIFKDDKNVELFLTNILLTKNNH